MVTIVDFKTGFIKYKLLQLGKLAYSRKDFKENIKLFKGFDNVNIDKNSYINTCFGYERSNFVYEVKLGNIIYGFEADRYNDYNKPFIYIMVKDIVIYHNRERTSCEGLFRGVKSGWNHRHPKKLLEQIKKDSKILKEAINYTNKNNKSKQWEKDQETLNGIFK